MNVYFICLGNNELHWLPMEWHIKFKVLMPMHNGLTLRMFVFQYIPLQALPLMATWLQIPWLAPTNLTVFLSCPLCWVALGLSLASKTGYHAIRQLWRMEWWSRIVAAVRICLLLKLETSTLPTLAKSMVFEICATISVNCCHPKMMLFSIFFSEVTHCLCFC